MGDWILMLWKWWVWCKKVLKKKYFDWRKKRNLMVMGIICWICYDYVGERSWKVNGGWEKKKFYWKM
jgi:hypothetical protein